MLKEQLNKEQKEAVEYIEGPLKIIAGAGSGKTRVLISKIINFINNDVDPSKICAITFTNKAVNEIKERITKKIEDSNIKNDIWISTYHSFCTKILRSDIHNYSNKHTKYFNIIDTNDQRAIIKNKFNENFKRKIDNNEYKKIIKQINYWKNNLLNPEKILNDETNKYFLEAKIYKEYVEHLQFSNSLDYDDLIIFVYELFKNNKIVLKKWQEKFKYYLIDEFQDTNNIQFEIIKMLTKNINNITIVGDPDQNIYSWRGANSKLIRDFELYYPKTKTIYLNQNYRSNNGILDLANNFIKNNYSLLDEVNKKSLFTNILSDYKPTLFSGDEYKDEIKIMILEIKKLIKNNYKYKDIFVLIRSGYLSQEIETQLALNRIPYKVIGSQNFFERKEIKDVLSFIKTIYLKDDTSLTRALSCFTGIGNKKIEEIAKLSEEKGKNIFTIVFEYSNELSNKTKKIITDFSNIFKPFLLKNNYSIEKITELLIEKFNYLDKFKNRIDKEDKEDNINELLSFINMFEKENKFFNKETKIMDFIDKISLLSNIKEEKNDNVISILTIHAAKGLENKIIFVPSICDEVLPSFRNMNENKLLQEERRLLYVAITRAKEKLFLSYNTGYSFQTREKRTKSLFFDEIDNKLINYKNLLFDDFENDLQEHKSKIEKNNKNLTTFNLNDNIIHPIFGIGNIIDIINDNIVIVEFENGETRTITTSALSIV